MVLQALDHIRLSQVVEKIARPLLLLGFTGLFRLSATRFDGRTLVLLATAVSAVCCLLILGLVIRKMRTFSDPAPAAGTPERHGGKTTWFFLFSLLYLLSTKVTMLMIPLFAGESAIGVFNIAYRFADLLILPFYLMHTVLPQLFARHAATGKDYTRSLFNESTRLMTLLALPLLLVILLAGPFLLRLFGPAFGAGYKALVYISLAQFLFSLFGPANTILLMQGRERYSAGCLLVYVGVLIGSSWLLLPLAGITGGALAILLSSAVYNGLLHWLVFRFYGIVSPFLSFLVKRR
jgi:O-antigen/teichoic acid export membrane protein